jgi:hypothetical protein
MLPVSVDDIIQTPYTMLAVLSSMRSLEQLEDAWNLIMNPTVKAGMGHEKQRNASGKYRIVRLTTGLV